MIFYLIKQIYFDIINNLLSYIRNQQLIQQQKQQDPRILKQRNQSSQPISLEYSYRFKFQNEKLWRKHLQQQGFVVIANWLPENICQKYVQQFWDIMQKLSQGKLNRNDLSTQKLSKNYPFVLHGGMIQYIGHSKPQWELRKLCKPIFQKIWNCQQVKTSFDGFCFMNGIRNYKKVEPNSFLHTDQSPTKNFVWSYQGIMSLTDSDEDGGGFVVVPKTHLYHRQFFKQKGLLNRKDNWYMFSEEDKLNQPLCNHIKVNNKAGDFILFDSRNFHCNTKPTTPTLRVCTYICMIAADKIPQKIKKMRQKAVQQRRTSNHHSGDGFKTFPVIPRYLQDPQHFKELIREVNSFPLQDDDQIMEMI